MPQIAIVKRCQGTDKSGMPCTTWALKGGTYCCFHANPMVWSGLPSAILFLEIFGISQRPLHAIAEVVSLNAEVWPVDSASSGQFDGEQLVG